MDTSWQSRQSDMEEWYRQLVAHPDTAASSLTNDYKPYIEPLAKLSGAVLDVGGGAGLAGAFLTPGTHYIVVDPSTMWLAESWADIRHRLSVAGGARPSFVSGTGERLPFSSSSFDAAIAFWSLNHASDPKQCVIEIHRVLKSHGRALIVLEDMEPTWPDIIQRAYQRLTSKLGLHVANPISWHQDKVKTLREAIRLKLSGKSWPVQPDHLRIKDDDLRHWLRQGFRVLDRSWKGGFLSYELERRT
jgi:ubiquinone/menaquinone biosynthesis C-methylase UbiE